MTFRGWDAWKGDWMGPLWSVIPWWAKERSPGWSTAHQHEWGLFLLECLLHNTAAMWQKERERTTQRHPQAQPIEMAEVMVPAHSSVRTPLGSTDWEVLDIVEHVYQWSMWWPQVNSPWWQEEYMMELWQQLSWSMARVHLREGLAPARPLPRARDTPMVTHPLGISSPWPGLKGQKWPGAWGRTHQWGSVNQGANIPDPNAGVILAGASCEPLILKLMHWDLPQQTHQALVPITTPFTLPSHRWAAKLLPEWP